MNDNTNNGSPNIDAIISENQFLRAAAHGLNDRLKYAESLLRMAMEFMTSIDYETAIDSAQCAAIATSIYQFLGKDEHDE